MIGAELTKVVQSALGVPGPMVWFTLPFRASAADRTAALPTVVDTLGATGWSTAVGRRTAGDTVLLCAPFAGRLRVERAGGVETSVLDNVTRAWLYRDLRRPGTFSDPLAPIPGTCRLTGLDPAGFRPVRAVRKEAARRGITEAAAAGRLLAAVRAGGAIDVSAGDILGRVGAAGPVTAALALIDGSSVPAAWLFRELGRRAPRSLPPADRGHPFVTASAPFAADPFLDLVVLDGADQFDSLPRGARRGTVEARWPGATVTLPIAEPARRFVLPAPAQAGVTVAFGLLVEGQRVPVTGAGGVGQGGAQVGTWELTSPVRSTVAPTLGPAGPAVVLRRPRPTGFTRPAGSNRQWDGVLLPLAPAAPPAGGGAAGTAAFQLRLEGVTNGGGPVTATVNGQAPVDLAVQGSAFSGDVPILAGGAHELVLTDGPATLRLGVLPVAVTMTAPRPAWWGSADPNVLPRSAPWPDPPDHRTLTRVETAHPQAVDEGVAGGWDRDALRLGARLLDNGALARELGAGGWTVAWTLILRTAMPFSVPEDAQPAPQPVRAWPPPRVRWIAFDLVGRGDGTGLDVAWDPPPLEAVRATAGRDNPPAAGVDDAVWNDLFGLADGTWAGGAPGPQGRTAAGPACGEARLHAEIRKDGALVSGAAPDPAAAPGAAPGAAPAGPGPGPAVFRVAGYRFDDVDWARFYQFLRGRVQARFGNAYPERQRIGLDADGLCGVMLAILARESAFLHFDSLDQIWATTDRSPAAQGGVDRAVWPRGPVTNAPPPAGVQVAGMPVTAQGADLGLGQIANRPTFAQYYDWRANLDRAVKILRAAFSISRVRDAGVRDAEVRRLLRDVRIERAGAPDAAADMQAARQALAAQPGPLDAFVAALRADPTPLLNSFVKLYNGAGKYEPPGDDEREFMPYRSTLVWDHATLAFAQPAGPAFTPHNGSSYIFAAQYGWAARYATVRNGFRAPDRVNGARVSTVGAVRRALFGLQPS